VSVPAFREPPRHAPPFFIFLAAVASSSNLATAKLRYRPGPTRVSCSPRIRGWAQAEGRHRLGVCRHRPLRRQPLPVTRHDAWLPPCAAPTCLLRRLRGPSRAAARCMIQETVDVFPRTGMNLRRLIGISPPGLACRDASCTCSLRSRRRPGRRRPLRPLPAARRRRAHHGSSLTRTPHAERVIEDNRRSRPQIVCSA